jgi:hypothetical protein
MDTKRLILYLAAIIVLAPLLLTPILARSVVPTKNLNPNVLMMQSAQD